MDIIKMPFWCFNLMVKCWWWNWSYMSTLVNQPGSVNMLLIQQSRSVKYYLAILVIGGRCLTAPAVDPWHSFTVPAVRRPSWSKQIALSPLLSELFHGQHQPSPGTSRQEAHLVAQMYPNRSSPHFSLYTHTCCNEAELHLCLSDH